MSETTPNNPVGYPIFDDSKIYIFESKSGEYYKLHRSSKNSIDGLYSFNRLNDSKLFACGISTADEQIKHAVQFGELKIFTSFESFIFWIHNKLTE